MHVCMPQSPSCPLPHINSPVFTIAQLDDTQIGQFLLESLPRLIANYQLIRSNPNIKIHYGYSAKHRNSTTYINSLHRLTAFRVLKWLGLDSRIITGDVTTTMAILPREGACQDPAYNAYEIAAMRKQLVPLAWKQCDECESVFKRKGIVIGMTLSFSTMKL